MGFAYWLLRRNIASQVVLFCTQKNGKNIFYDKRGKDGLGQETAEIHVAYYLENSRIAAVGARVVITLYAAEPHPGSKRK